MAMTTLIINQDKKGIPTEFETWEDLQDYILQKLMVNIYPLKDKDVTNEMRERVETMRQTFKNDPQSFDNI